MSDRDDIAELLLAQGAGDGSVSLPPEFYGAPPGAPISNEYVDLSNRDTYNKAIYEATDRPTMARDERLGPDPHPSFNEFRQSKDVVDRRFDPALTPEQQAQYKAQNDSPKGQFRYTPAEHAAALAQAKTPLAQALGSDDLEILELNAAEQRMARGQ